MKKLQRSRAREPENIEVVGARVHNLRVDYLAIPKRSLVVFTGVSGSGKSSLAFDTLYAEGQRRYVETLSSYARQFLGQLDRPDVDHLRGLSPTVAIEQKSASSNPRSTVGTLTEIHDYLRVLYARAGEQRCLTCGQLVAGRSVDEIVADVLASGKGKPAMILAPIVEARKGEFRELFDDLRARGFVRVEVDGAVHRLDALPALDKKKKHTLALVIDRLPLDASSRSRLAEAIEQAVREGRGTVLVDAEKTRHRYGTERSCCGVNYPEPSPQQFSFNSPLGMCPQCNGLGTSLAVDAALVIPDATKSIAEGAIAPWASAMAKGEGWTKRIVDAVAKATGVDLNVPWNRISKKKQELVLYGLDGKRISVSWGKEGTKTQGTWDMRYEGVIPMLLRRMRQTQSEAARESYRKYMNEQTCEGCRGRRLRPESLAVQVAGKNIADLCSCSVHDAHEHLTAMQLPAAKAKIAASVLREVRSRLTFLLDVGLDYLSLDRAGPSLSGGEAQRIRLASQLGSELSGVTYVLDEPSIGLHQRDNARLLGTLERLRDLGNSVVVVEHDEDTIRAADHVVDFGPGAGHLGGRVMAEGTPQDIADCRESLTGDYLAGRRRIEPPRAGRKPARWLEIRGAQEHNLRNLDVRIPLGVFTAVTGVSGAGKSSLVSGILLPALQRRLHNSTDAVGAFNELRGAEEIERVIAIDQKPIGRTPRSNPGTYTKAFDLVREVFAMTPEARARGFGPGRFSFNLKGGRCETCQGGGTVKVEMHFLADVYVRCEACQGRRYDAQTLAVHYKGMSIADVLDTSVEEGVEWFAAFPALVRILRTLQDVGLGYLKLGQPATTLSGGEAQRVKLSRELGKGQAGKTLYILDEPTTGLHFEDVRRLLEVLHRLVEAGNSVVVIEHNLDVVRCADWVIDLGPEGGAKGGYLVAEGPPAKVARCAKSYTGKFLAAMGRHRAEATA